MQILKTLLLDDHIEINNKMLFQMISVINLNIFKCYPKIELFLDFIANWYVKTTLEKNKS
jgi:hypothetical protein